MEVEKMTWSMRDRIEGLGLRPPVVVSPDVTLTAAAHTLWLEDVGAVVVEEGSRAIGILSERDLVERVARGEDLDRVRVREVMTPHLIAAKSGDTVHDAAYQMLESGIRHLPVLDEGDNVIGMVSIRDLLRPVITDEVQRPLG
jgi:CBS domain-containing protein